MAAKHLIPEVVAPRDQLCERRQQQKKYYDCSTRTLPPLQSDDVVRVKHDKQWLRGRVIQPHDTPRSYVVETEDGSTLRRNRRDLIRTAEDEMPVCAPYIEDVPTTKNAAPSATSAPSSVSSPTLAAAPPPILKTTIRGRVVKPPVRFADYDMSASRRRK